MSKILEKVISEDIEPWMMDSQHKGGNKLRRDVYFFDFGICREET